MLLDKGANIDVKDNNGYTSLHFACMHIYTKTGVAPILVQRGAAVNVVAAVTVIFKKNFLINDALKVKTWIH